MSRTIIAPVRAKRDTLANWTGIVPLEGLLCYCTTAGSRCLFIGDGTTAAQTLIASALTGGYTLPDATASVKGGIKLAGDLAGTAASPVLANTAVTAGNYKSANVTVDAKGRITAASQGVCGFTLTVVPSFGLASAAFVAPFPMSLTRIDIISKSAAGVDLAPSSSTTMAAYKNGSSALTQAFTTAATTNASISLALAAGDVVYLLQSAANGTAQVSATFRGVRA